MSGRWGGVPTIEGCGSIVLAIGDLIKLGEGRSAFTAIYSGLLAGNPYNIAVAVLLGPGDRGKLTITHPAFNHLTTIVDAASYTVDLMAIPWQFGGRRWFMLCTRSGRRVLKLYLPNGAQRFASRASMGLVYRVQRLGPIEKGHARLARAFAKLGARYNHLHQSIPARPKGMRLKTYDRRVADIEAAIDRHRETYVGKLRGLMASEDRALAR